ncbi:NAD(P)/FAD-dependent oxidoreductase [Rhodococcus sp. T7]|uniref:NAD(P)/FAD-dependent oxidoreductase n=1 Tax=Rhodococcus sp. T7 TaxID=627444 RepID=UPI0013C85E92|nr:FAD-dependent oxidoreductase [Rhodococcus sp. T7]KAF0957984.1 Ferredoxin--NAD(P)(+) reductase fdr [Rhodococcus sp. T7]KAF0960143.1 Ferredoxin--NAD(P)(+) reductase fdr [Rhodococcus sp. T7]
MITSVIRHHDTLIVGAGQAGAQVATALDAAGYEGSIGILGSELVPPYERPPLSKGVLTGQTATESLFLRPPEFWRDDDMELMLGTDVVAVDPSRHVVRTSTGAEIGYGKLVWATGGRPRRLTVPGAELAGVHYLRTLRDAERLQSHLITAARAVVIGGGFIGLEAAAAFTKAGLAVTVIESADRVLQRVTSPAVSAHFRALHRRHGVDILERSSVSEITGRNGEVTGVQLDNGRWIAAELVLIGVGLLPNVEALRDAGAEGVNGADVDDAGSTSLPDVYAAGDCASISNSFTGHTRMRLESVQNAVEQGRVVAASILGSPNPLKPVPWFWSNQYDVKFKTMGVPIAYDAAVVRGTPQSGAFSVVYLRDDQVVAVDTVNNLRDYAQAKVLIECGTRVDADLVRSPDMPLKEFAERKPAHVS